MCHREFSTSFIADSAEMVFYTAGDELYGSVIGWNFWSTGWLSIGMEKHCNGVSSLIGSSCLFPLLVYMSHVPILM